MQLEDRHSYEDSGKSSTGSEEHLAVLDVKDMSKDEVVESDEGVDEGAPPPLLPRLENYSYRYCAFLPLNLLFLYSEPRMEQRLGKNVDASPRPQSSPEVNETKSLPLLFNV
jgi:hypothetical protein